MFQIVPTPLQPYRKIFKPLVAETSTIPILSKLVGNLGVYSSYYIKRIKFWSSMPVWMLPMKYRSHTTSMQPKEH